MYSMRLAISAFSASNAFSYDFRNNSPYSTFTFDLVYGRQKVGETLTIGSLNTVNLFYQYDTATFVSSLLYTSSISSYNGDFVNMNVQNLNAVNQIVSTVSSYNANFITLNTSNISGTTATLTTINSSNISSVFIATSTISSYIVNVIKNKIRYEKENEICMVWYQL